MVEIKGLSAAIEGVPILRDVNLVVRKGEMVGLVGRNGAGKTTLMRCLMGLLRPTSGHIQLFDTDVTDTEGYWRARNGIGYMPEDRRLVLDLSVEENILLPAWAVGVRDAPERLAWVYGLMPEVQKFGPRLATSLSGGQQKLVAMARALLVGQKVLLLDEPFEGVAPTLCQRLVEVIMALKGKGLSVLISESDYTYTKAMVDRTYAIERGSVAASSR